MQIGTGVVTHGSDLAVALSGGLSCRTAGTEAVSEANFMLPYRFPRKQRSQARILNQEDVGDNALVGHVWDITSTSSQRI